MSDLQTVLGLGAVAVLVDLAIRLVALVVVPRNRLPTAAMAWLLAIFFIPVIGVVLFLLIGSPKLPKDRRRKQAEMNAVVAEEYAQEASPAEMNCRAAVQAVEVRRTVRWWSSEARVVAGRRRD